MDEAFHAQEIGPEVLLQGVEQQAAVRRAGSAPRAGNLIYVKLFGGEANVIIFQQRWKFLADRRQFPCIRFQLSVSYWKITHFSAGAGGVMRRMIALLAAAAALSVGLSQFAAAADMPAKAPVYKAPPAAVAYNWTGLYVGGYVGGAWASRDVTSSEPAYAIGPVAWNVTFFDNVYGLGSSVIAGGTVGYNWQAPDSQWVFGAEAEVGYLHLKKTVVDINAALQGRPANGSDTTRLGDFYGVIAGRIGYNWNRLLIYAKGGVAFVDKHYDFTDSCAILACGINTLFIVRNKTDWTWAAGGGLEYGFGDSWSIKGEYLYLATQETTTVSGVASNGFTFSVVHSDPGVHIAKLGINYRFGSVSPVGTGY